MKTKYILSFHKFNQFLMIPNKIIYVISVLEINGQLDFQFSEDLLVKIY